VVNTPGKKGFGFTLISAMGRSLSTSPAIQLNRAGLECKIRVPLETLVPAKSEQQVAIDMQTFG
jgi:two-component sensor histidine kinase